MAEYIEREAAYEKCGWYNTVNGKSIYAVRKDELAAITAADVAPVRHGRWEWHKDHWECSNCRGSRFHDLVLGLDAAHCGYCGAKMDLEAV